MAREEPDLPAPPPPSLEVVDTAVRHAVYLQRVASHVSAEVRAEAVRVADETIRLLNELDAELSSLESAELGSLIAEAKAANTQIMLDALDTLTPHLEALGLYEGQFTARALAAQTRKVKIRALKASEAYKAAKKEPLAATGELLDGFLEDWTKRQVKAVGDLIGKGYAQGWTNQQLTTALRGTRAAGYADGMVAGIGRNADAVVRTSIMHVCQAARNETWAKNSDVVVGVRIIATLEGNRNWVCICPSLDGRVFKLGEGPRPPFHINCKCSEAPELDPEFAFLNEGETRSSAKGYVPAEQTYYEWLKDQTAAFQDDAIGPQRAQLLRDGGLTADEFARLNLGRNFQPLTLDEMRRKEPNAFKKAGL